MHAFGLNVEVFLGLVVTHSMSPCRLCSKSNMKPTETYNEASKPAEELDLFNRGEHVVARWPKSRGAWGRGGGGRIASLYDFIYSR